MLWRQLFYKSRCILESSLHVYKKQSLYSSSQMCCLESSCPETSPSKVHGVVQSRLQPRIRTRLRHIQQHCHTGSLVLVHGRQKAPRPLLPSTKPRLQGHFSNRPCDDVTKDSICAEPEVRENRFHRQVAENLPRGMKYLLSVGVIIVH